MQRPYTLIAELTHRCPLRCPYCSNPVELLGRGSEIDTATWRRVLVEAEALGVVQVCFTGGEPLLRDDLEALVVEARALGLYSNLITSGLPLDESRLGALRDAGLDALQLSIQDAREEPADRIAGTPSFQRKLAVAAWARRLELPLTLNVVLHRENLDRVDEVIALAESLDPDRIELANAQYLGWALANRAALLPTREQLERARSVAADARARLRGRIEMIWVTPDYFGEAPPACMDGWGRRFLVVAPDGVALPCHLARTVPSLAFENVRHHSLESIWRDSPAFNAFRGESWMPPTCRDCDRKTIDFGGCRCQAFHLTGDAAATDPACARSPHHALVAAPRGGAWRYRRSGPGAR
jgi:pyrroloquinoline quinone biosynthesis protein E